MRWLLIALLVSLGGLLLAAAGVARHVWVHRKQLKQKQLQSDVVVVGAPEESDLS
ncbi:hypothetical protein [Occallatibacter savannae]|uniref:hypothetical protein n=1 Tax=Occallatibacter savannae TaxID=1002691 RepID=UPI0013A53BBE|nr:hypothetical protein [Occallatibacter savannae]